MKDSVVEMIVGTLVIVVCVIFLVYGYANSGLHEQHGYMIKVPFSTTDGLSRGSEVRLNGIKIGTVADLVLDQKTYTPTANLVITPDIKIPTDSSAKITSSGLLGASYIAITPGGDEEYLKNGDEIQYAQGSVDFLGLIGQAILGVANGGKKTSSPPSAP